MMKALNALNERQSRVVVGLKKLNAKKMKMAELRSTRDQSPYAGISLGMSDAFGRWN